MKKALFIIIILSGKLAPQIPLGKTAEILIRHTADFEISGEGTAENWNTTQWIPLINRKGEASYTTNTKCLYSETGLYVLFSCSDTKINATITQDFADLFKEDVIEIFIWPDESEPIYLEYELSPLNYELPILVPHFEENIFGWMPWHYEGERKTRHATKIIKDKNDEVVQWMAEIFIPYKLLQPLRNVVPKKGTHWRANFYRIDYDNEITYWSWQPFKDNFHDFEMYGSVRFE
jgi:hypothetical protein